MIAAGLDASAVTVVSVGSAAALIAASELDWSSDDVAIPASVEDSAVPGFALR